MTRAPSGGAGPGGQTPWLLAVDVGNTHITLGAFVPGGTRSPSAPQATWRLSTHAHATADEYGLTILGLLSRAGLDPSRLVGTAVASVVPPLDPVFRDISKKYLRCDPLCVGPGVRTGVRVLLDNPAEIGADRLVNAAAAFARVGRSCIVVDFGTAATFDCVNGKGAYLGGAIAPGPHMAAEFLSRRTAKLPLLNEFRCPATAIGKNTQDSMASGLFYGYVGLTRGLAVRLAEEMGDKPFVMATGGLAGLLAPAIPEIREVVPHLTLEGLHRIWVINQGK